MGLCRRPAAGLIQRARAKQEKAMAEAGCFVNFRLAIEAVHVVRCCDILYWFQWLLTWVSQVVAIVLERSFTGTTDPGRFSITLA